MRRGPKQDHRAMETTPAQRKRLGQRAEVYAQQLIAEGRDPGAARRDALQAYGLEANAARRPLGPDLPREYRRALLEQVAGGQRVCDLSPRPRTPAELKAASRARLKAMRLGKEATP